PPALQVLVRCTPLYQGVALERALTTGTVGPGILLHVLYLLAMGVLGLRVASKRMHVLLQP
ncbi:MAG: ABC transporter, partial [Acidimicrobiia bacterium]|nr:ABC transporter [Acidimicrobiia bacterium]